MKPADDNHHRRGDGEKADLVWCQMQRLLRQHQQRAGHDEVVAVDEAHKREHRDQNHVVAAERDAVELASEHMASR
jgi:hypothetical protein